MGEEAEQILTEEQILLILQEPHEPDSAPFSGRKLNHVTFPKQLSFANFTGATFLHVVDLSDTTFLEKATFVNTVFKEGVTCVDTTFKKECDFTEARFYGPAYFWRCHFFSTGIFRRCSVAPVSHDEDRRYKGEINFSYTIFDGEADFKRFQFGGPTIFHRTSFKNTADFEETTFSDRTRFEGHENDICIPAREISSTSLTDRLLEAKILFKNTDHPANGQKGFYNFNPSLDKEKLKWAMNLEEERIILNGPTFQLRFRPKDRRNKLPDYTPKKGILFSDEEHALVESLRGQYANPTFSRFHRVTFVRADFRAEVIFSEVNLSRTLFQQTGLDKAIFVAVVWNRLPLTFGTIPIFDRWLGRRDGLYDEDKEVRNEKGLLQDAYHDIRITYQRRGDIEHARDFYYGELELRYKAQSFRTRCFSFLFFYRFLTGFGRQQGLAFLWLASLALVFFPIIWFYAGLHEAVNLTYLSRFVDELSMRQHPQITAALTRFLLAELNSLEACTFIARDIAKYPAEQRLIAGFERLAVGTQLTLFILSLKWKFERNPGSS